MHRFEWMIFFPFYKYGQKVRTTSYKVLSLFGTRHCGRVFFLDFHNGLIEHMAICCFSHRAVSLSESLSVRSDGRFWIIICPYEIGRKWFCSNRDCSMFFKILTFYHSHSMAVGASLSAQRLELFFFHVPMLFLKMCGECSAQRLELFFFHVPMLFLPQNVWRINVSRFETSKVI